jgi:hypothetical protein
MRRIVMAVAVLGFAAGCATATRQAKFRPPAEIGSDGIYCELVTNAPYDRRNEPIDPRNTDGPSKVVYINPNRTVLVHDNGGLYRCESEI